MNDKRAEATVPATRSDFADFVSMSTRWEDVDVYGHVNNVKYYSYFDTAVNAWLIERGLLKLPDAPTFGIVVATECNYLSELRFPQDLEIGLRIDKLGNTSVNYVIGIFAEGADEMAAWGRFVHVYVDAATRRPVTIPDHFRAAFASLQR